MKLKIANIILTTNKYDQLTSQEQHKSYRSDDTAKFNLKKKSINKITQHKGKKNNMSKRNISHISANREFHGIQNKKHTIKVRHTL